MIDFTNNQWGHAIHPSTWREVPYSDPITRYFKKRAGIARYSIMCHTSADVAIGGKFKYNGPQGVVIGTIAGVKYEHNVNDMYTLIYTVDKDGRPSET